MSNSPKKKSKHPHFDENRIVWRDDYSGVYPPPPPGYSNQFELQWRLALEKEDGYYDNPGASIDDEYIRDRVYEWLGDQAGQKSLTDHSQGARALDYPLSPDLIRGKDCIDIGCGMGRWTGTMKAIGAKSVLSVDISDSAIKSVSRINDRVVQTDIMRIPEEHPEWVGKFDFACFWGVAMCTHDPLKAFLSAAATVKPGGSMYLMVYCPEGMHNTHVVNLQRRRFHQLETVQDRLAYVNHVFHREWDAAYPFKDNVRNLLIRLAAIFVKRWRGSKVGFLDLLEPYYNWVIPIEVIESWMQKGGFTKFRLLYKKPRSAYHILATK